MIVDPDLAPADPPLAAAPAAHRRPGLVALLYAYRALAGLVLALPVAAAVGALSGDYPRGQAVLFDPGGLMLLESIRLLRRTLPAVGYALGPGVVIATAFGLFPLALLIAGLGQSGRLSAAFLTARAWAHAGTLALMFGLGALAQVLAVVVVSLVGFKIVAATRVAPPGEDLASLAVVAVALLAAAVLGVVRDLAYVAAVHGGHRFYTATSRALRCLIQAPARTLFAWSSRAILGLAILAFAAWAAPAARNASTAAVFLAVIFHQFALAAGAFLRASWLASGIRLLDLTAPVRSPVFETEPAVPSAEPQTISIAEEPANPPDSPPNADSATPQ
ncbi:MAG: hypothetical protein QM820_37860 [Minicystis sp.]